MSTDSSKPAEPIPVSLPDPVNAKIDQIEKAATVTANQVERLGLPTFLLIIFSICTAYVVIYGGARVWTDIVLPARDQHFQFMATSTATQQKIADATVKIEGLMSEQKIANLEHRAKTDHIAVRVEQLKEDIELVKERILTTFFGASLNSSPKKKPTPADQGYLGP